VQEMLLHLGVLVSAWSAEEYAAGGSFNLIKVWSCYSLLFSYCERAPTMALGNIPLSASHSRPS